MTQIRAGNLFLHKLGRVLKIFFRLAEEKLSNRECKERGQCIEQGTEVYAKA